MKKNEPYLKWGLTVFLTVCAILLVYDTFFSSATILLLLRRLVRILMPVLYGLFLAYLLAPVVDFFERSLCGRLNSRAQAAGRPHSRAARAISIVLTMLAMFVLFYLLLSILIPELYKSITQLVDNASTYYNVVYSWINKLLADNPELEKWTMSQLDASYQDLLSWLTQKVVPQAQLLLTAVTGGIVDVLVFTKNFLIGVIVSVYLLGTKEGCAAASRKLLYSICQETRARWALRGIHKADSIFSGFVRGKLLDSLIIGILCFFFSTLFKFPYAPLVSVVVGVTNIIPFFGPFLGAIPSAFLILLVSPIKCFYFALFILALQQVDGNIIGPKILGDSTGLSSFWVIVAILVGGGFFGVPGMFFGVPIFACIYTAIQFYAEIRLQKKNLPLALEDYSSDSPGGRDEGK